MICGMGIDIADIERIGKVAETHDSPFTTRVFTEAERGEAEQRRDFAGYYAGRWAVKEAVSKALKCGIGENCSWQEIETLNLPGGQPQTRLKGRALQTFKNSGARLLHVTLSHDKGSAVAMVILES